MKKKKNLKVKELIKILSDFNPNAETNINDYGGIVYDGAEVQSERNIEKEKLDADRLILEPSEIVVKGEDKRMTGEFYYFEEEEKEIKLINVTQLKNEIMNTCYNMQCDTCEFLNNNCKNECKYVIAFKELEAIIDLCGVDGDE